VDDQVRPVTSMKLNGSNYHSWSHAFKVLSAKKKLKYLTECNDPEKSANHICTITPKGLVKLKLP
jgi:hypothetical protein